MHTKYWGGLTIGNNSLGKPRRWKDKISVGNTLSGIEVDRTGLQQYPVAAFGA